MPKATGMASREGASTPGTVGSCIPGPAAGAAGAHGLWPRCRRTGSALKAPELAGGGPGGPGGGGQQPNTRVFV